MRCCYCFKNLLEKEKVLIGIDFDPDIPLKELIAMNAFNGRIMCQKCREESIDKINEARQKE